MLLQVSKPLLPQNKQETSSDHLAEMCPSSSSIPLSTCLAVCLVWSSLVSRAMQSLHANYEDLFMKLKQKLLNFIPLRMIRILVLRISSSRSF